MTFMQLEHRDASMSDCGTYRYWLRRTWDASLPACAFIMLNPSTADAVKDDPTIRRVMGFAKSWGFGSVSVYNLFALRATDPRELRNHADPVGPDNDAHLLHIPVGTSIVAAWGAWGDYENRGLNVRRMFPNRLSCIGRTAAGHPKHPLYLPAAAKREPYPNLVECDDA